MNKKIVLIIIGIFLLTGFTTISVAEMKANESKIEASNFCECPDLTIEIIMTTKILKYQVEVVITNEGAVEVPAGEYIVWNLRDDEYTSIWMKEELQEPLLPGESITSPQCGEIDFCKSISSGAEIIAIVDPVGECGHQWPELDPDPCYGLIKETNEDNNIDTIVLPNSAPANNQEVTQGSLPLSN